ncbi:hypothetical protein QUF88_11835 [Bacillus sp. DX1.1]|uniref:hypothetical protein n=1 Tax=unclassified Bacillus (in: firmicutes) TaxID=185979 RepID=UPI0025712DF4|nr:MULTISPECIES: hypothetical protein [unclassified Bacillus (in: firmicutes)]MDM5154499.1 hypothetical protein [Bacillus sp. DX1.1]WJE83398.1 hypothetical protein QRE67_09335 [Bacillus sp. DX3.1]
MEQIIENNENRHIEVYYALVCGLSLFTFKKISAIETKKAELKIALKTQRDGFKKENPYKL